MDIYAEVTARIIDQMENGIIPWEKPWIACGKAVSHATGKAYSLLNQMLLGRPGEYLTFKQCQEAGGRVRKGEKSHMVVFWKWIETEDEETGEKKEVPFLRYYNVFHIDQCEGVTAKHTHEVRFPDGAETLEAAQEVIYDYLSREGVKLTHSTGHPSRLNRLNRPSFFGTEDYSKEELVAEIGAAALVNHVGLETDHSFRNSTAYVQNWLQVLKDDKRFIVSAAGKAEKAVNLILGSAD